MSKRSVTLIYSILFIGLASCSAPKITTQVMIPAQAPEVAALHKIAVLPFEGRSRGDNAGKEATAEMESLLTSITKADDGKPRYFLVDRLEIDRLMEEMAFGQSGLVDQQTTAKIGQFTGAEAIITGNVSNWGVKSDGYRTSQKYCDKRTALLETAIKVIEIKSSRIVYAKTNAATVSFDPCDAMAQLKATFSGERLAQSDIELMGVAKGVLRAQWRAAFAPYFVTVSQQLMDGESGIVSDAGSRALASGIEFALSNRLDRACEIWADALKTEDRSPALLFNTAFCHEVKGERQLALKLYERADRLLPRPVDYVGAALKRVRANPAGR